MTRIPRICYRMSFKRKKIIPGGNLYLHKGMRSIRNGKNVDKYNFFLFLIDLKDYFKAQIITMYCCVYNISSGKIHDKNIHKGQERGNRSIQF